MLLHENDTVNYTTGWNFCVDNSPSAPLPAECSQVNTRIGRAIDTNSVIWLVAAFPANSSPGVTAYQLGIYGDVPRDYFSGLGSCGSIEIADPDWPAPGTGTAVAYANPVFDRLFKLYWFAVSAPSTGASISTGPYPHGAMLAQWADDSNPPLVDDCYLFGTARWGVPGHNSCPDGPAYEARCFADCHYEDLVADECVAAGGTPQGLGTSCDSFECDCPPAACCFPDGSCRDLVQSACEDAGGTPEGEGTACATFSCPEACCFCDLICENLPPEECLDRHGSPQGQGSSCETYPCRVPPFGACCIGQRCVLVSELCCDEQSGDYQGDDTDCDPNPCIPSPTRVTTRGEIKAAFR